MERGGKRDLRCEACSLKLAALATKLCQTGGSLAQGCQAGTCLFIPSTLAKVACVQTQPWALGKRMIWCCLPCRPSPGSQTSKGLNGHLVSQRKAAEHRGA